MINHKNMIMNDFGFKSIDEFTFDECFARIEQNRIDGVESCEELLKRYTELLSSLQQKDDEMFRKATNKVALEKYLSLHPLDKTAIKYKLRHVEEANKKLADIYGDPTQESILELYPEYNFVVATTRLKKAEAQLRRTRAYLLSVCTTIAILGIIGLIGIGHWHPDGYIAFNVFIFSVLAGRLLFPIITSKISKLKYLNSNVYYIQSLDKCKKDRYKYAFIVSENRKWGLIKIKGQKIVIPPTYDSMEWRRPNELLTVCLNNKREIRDINNNLCI